MKSSSELGLIACLGGRKCFNSISQPISEIVHIFTSFSYTSEDGSEIIINLKFSGKPVEHHEDITSTIKSLRHDMHKVLHYIDHLSKDVIQNKGTEIKGESINTTQKLH